MSKSITYSRAVGFFTSSSLAIAAQGLNELILKNGSMRLIASPQLNKSDIEAIKQGYIERESAVEASLIRELHLQNMPHPVRERLGFLSWMVAEGTLDIKIATIDTGGIFHEKTGIFVDEDNNTVAFSGSANESAGGWLENFECIDVYLSWRVGDEQRVAEKQDDFEALWTNTTPGVQVIEFPEAAKLELLKLKPEKQPLRDPSQSRFLKNEELARLHLLKVSLKPWQEDAKQAWLQADAKGILAMATGTGKTITALACASALRKIDLILIAVPTIELVNQWKKEILLRTTYDEPVVVAGDSSLWMETVYRKLKLLNRKDIRSSKLPILFIGTYRSFSRPEFMGLVSDAGGMPQESLLIADEAHVSGAKVLQNCLQPGFQYRLGLSATPIREYDSEGTQSILDYFGSVVFELSLAKALELGVLCQYDYFVYPVILTDEEYDEYRELTRRIQGLISGGEKSNVDNSADIELLRIKRAQCLKGAQEKTSIIRTVVQKHSLKRGMVYCADIEQANYVSQQLNVLGLNAMRYSSEDVNRKDSLENFARGYIDTLVSVKCLDEGVDVPSASVAFLLASDTTERQFIQRRGRILRTAPEKKVAKLIDILVSPPSSTGRERLFTSELERVILFAKLARNKFTLINTLVGDLSHYGISHSDFL